MRILVLTNRYPPDALGGYELLCRDVVGRLRARGHHVDVLARLPHTWDGDPPPPVWRRPVVERRAGRMVADALARHQPDVVSIWNMTGVPGSVFGLLARRAIPIVAVISDVWPARMLEGDPWLAPLGRRPVVAAIASRITGVATALPDLGRLGRLCFCSADLRDRVLSAMGWSTTDAVVTPSGVDPTDFPPAVGPRGRDWNDRLLFVGRLDPGKGVDTLIRAMVELPPTASLTVVGPPEEAHLTRLTRLVAELDVRDRVRFSTATRAELAAVYGAADVCVFPSEWPEPFGIVPLEAMACATPVVATGAGGSGEYLVDGENCVLFRAGDPGALAAAVRRLAADADLRDRVAIGGLRSAGYYTVDRLADQLDGIHRAVVTAARSGT